MLREWEWRPCDIELVCVTTGPGSFTGLRIGVVAAKTFAFATAAQLVGVHTLAAIAAGVEQRPKRLWTILDAQRQELFVSKFDGDRSIVDQLVPETGILGIQAWLDRLGPGDAVAGPPLGKLRPQLPDGINIVDEQLWHPMAVAVGKLGVQLRERGESIDPLKLLPHYYRRSAAEEKAASTIIPRSLTGG
jgi:tRNA threonylcarbamoyladenosine biosynthesis protein TsaB